MKTFPQKDVRDRKVSAYMFHVWAMDYAYQLVTISSWDLDAACEICRKMVTGGYWQGYAICR